MGIETNASAPTTKGAELQLPRYMGIETMSVLELVIVADNCNFLVIWGLKLSTDLPIIDAKSIATSSLYGD